jgi:hypothetical protein
MADVVEAAVNSIRVTPCPGCGSQTLAARAGSLSPCVVTCSSCDRSWDALADVTVVRNTRRLHGNCCSGFRRHELLWRQGPEHPFETTRFQTWAQDRLLLRPDDVVSLLFEPHGLDAGSDTRWRPRMPLLVANHTFRAVWALVGSVAVVTLR